MTTALATAPRRARLQVIDGRPYRHLAALGTQAQALARRFERANLLLMAAVEQYPETLWRAEAVRGEESAAAETFHVAQQHPLLASFIPAVATDRPLPRLDDSGAHGAAGAARPTPALRGRPALLELLRRNGALSADIIRGLSDEQLARATSYFGTELTAAQLVDELLIGHLEEHGARLLARRCA
jgi:uncharacterized damage-inducible protein DinB